MMIEKNTSVAHRVATATATATATVHTCCNGGGGGGREDELAAVAATSPFSDVVPNPAEARPSVRSGTRT